ncbi:hypothetical protein FRB95_010650 [Tulasnella sp. JGI-2019a]|nr:hypothetical protein FRB95_010650 [Tulasnella sp. JGI-2019a]
MDAIIEPYTLHVPDELLADLKLRLEHTRYPQELNLPAGQEWSYGTPVNEVRDLVDYWKTSFDWRKVEVELNTKLPQFTTVIDTGVAEHGSLKIHFAHRRSSRPNAIPLLFIHGWPGNFAECLKMVDELVEPADPKHPAFRVVSPCIPGYGFSDPPTAPGFGLRRTADVFDKLMKRLGYSQYITQGGDWGSFVARGLALWHPESCRAILVNLFVVHPSLLIWHPIMLVKTILGSFGVPGGYSAEQMNGLKITEEFQKTGSAYSKIQAQRPQTLGFAMTDSPAGLLSWVREKYHAWTHNYPWTKDELLMFTMLYWIPGPAPSFRFYRENMEGQDGGKDWDAILKGWSSVPLGVSTFKGEICQFPDEWGCMLQPLKFIRRHDRGGHFAAWEVPELLLDDIREFTNIVLMKEPLFLGSMAPERTAA